MSVAETTAVRFLRIEDVLPLTGVRSKSGLYRLIRAGKFPPGEKLSHRTTVWPEPVVARWQYQHLPADLRELLG